MNAISRARDYSPFLRLLLDTQPELAGLLHGDDLDGAITFAREAGRVDDCAVALRRQRKALALALAIGDLAGRLSLADVTRRLSDFADEALDRALAAIFAGRYNCEPRGFAIISLGKHGGRELNYSSDIDPIFLYDPDALPTRGREEPADAARRIGKALVEMLSERTADGYVFRVDMRLRPSPEVSPIALPVEAAISYYESAALTWEQAAFIRARAAAGDRALGEDFLEAIRPFIWRRSLDYGAIRTIGSVSAQIRDHYASGQAFGPGYDLKRGRGGIREAEFYAQMHQLIFGGRDPELRLADTRAALAALSEAGHIDRAKAQRLSQGYEILRTIEHRLQMVNDQQTHALPDDAEKMDRVARLHGLGDGNELLDLLQPHVKTVGQIYDELIETDESDALPEDPGRLAARLAKDGIADTAHFAGRIEKWRSGHLRALQSSAAREAFERVLPDLVRALGQSPAPEQALNRLERLLEQLPSMLNIFQLLEARPALLDLLGRILSHAPTLADALAQRAELIDGLIDATAFDLPPAVPALVTRLSDGEDDEDYQILLDRVRAEVGELRFALGVQLIEGKHDALAIAAAYSRVAEAAMRVLTRATIAEFAENHGFVPQSEFLILALGRLGGEELTHASDLDLVFLFTGEHSGQSDGRRPMGATRYYNRLAQKVVAALSVPTAAGPLYDIDTRLRPSGVQGLLAVSVDSFENYQRKKAWTWEHMALTRSRPVFGSDAACEDLQRRIREVLKEQQRLDGELLRKAVRKMRLDMVAHKPPKGPLDAKLIEGGLVDWEFIVHFLQLKTGEALTPHLSNAAERLVAMDELDSGMISAHALMTRLLIALRLIAPDGDYPPETSRPLIAKAAGADDWDDLLARFRAARQCVIEQWNRHLRPDPDERLEDLI